MRQAIIALLILLGLMFGGPAVLWAFGDARIAGDWSTATHNPTGLAPSPQATPEAVVQVYAARAFGWRGVFAVHTWLAVKPANASRYTRYEVIGWNVMRGGRAVVVGSYRAPDAEWFGARPWLLADLRGDRAEAVVARLDEAVKRYPWADSYTPWPGPNSNTFVAHIARSIPELGLTLPPHALGKDYLGAEYFAWTPSGTGVQMSLNGVLGLAVGVYEGGELNVLGLVLGIDPLHLSVKLPGLGGLGPTGWQ
jgi:hypothetical protein